MVGKRRRDTPQPVTCGRCGTTASTVTTGGDRCTKCGSYLPTHLRARRSVTSWRVWTAVAALTGLFLTDRARGSSFLASGAGSVTDALTVGFGALLLVAVGAMVVHAVRHR